MYPCGRDPAAATTTGNVHHPTREDGIPMEFARNAFGIGMTSSGRVCGHNGSSDCCTLIGLGNYCGRTEKEKLEDANLRMDNRIFFMGITAHGYQKPILEGINPDVKYRDANVGKPQMSSFLPAPAENETVDYEKVAENFRSIDVYSGLVDGRNYGRFNRLRQHKIRHMRNPNGTEKRFCIPITGGMEYGWWNRDLEQLNVTKWYAVRERAPVVRGDITKFVDDMYHHDPSFMLF